MEYLNIDILFDRVGKKYKASIVNSPGGQASVEFKRPFSEAELKTFLLQIGNPRRQILRSVSHDIQAVKAFGSRLFEILFNKEMLVCFHRSVDDAKSEGKGLRIRLRLTFTPELADLPWEYLYDPSLNRFLSLSYETPIVRFLDLPERVRPLTAKCPLKILVMISSPIDYPALDAVLEFEKLNTALEALIKLNLVVVERLPDPTLSVLTHQLRMPQYHVLHYIGHGAFDIISQDGVLVFKDDNQKGQLIRGELLGMLLKDHHTLRLVILNSCEGARTSIANSYTGVAQSLVQQGVPAVIAMQFEVTDEAAITFSQEFYTALAQGHPIDEAMAETRKIMCACRDSAEWGIPVLYMRSSDGNLFQLNRIHMIERPGTTEVLSEESLQKVRKGKAAEKIIPQKPTYRDDEAKRKKRLIHICKASIFILLVAMLSILLLNTLKTRSVLVDVQLEVNECSFQLMDDWTLFSLDAKIIAVSDLDNLSLGIWSVEQEYPMYSPAHQWVKIDDGQNFLVKGIEPNWGVTFESPYLRITELHIDSGAVITLFTNDTRPKELHLRITDGNVSGNINTADTLVLSCEHCQAGNAFIEKNKLSRRFRLIMFDNQIEIRDVNKNLAIMLGLKESSTKSQSIEIGEFIPIHSIKFMQLIGEKIQPTIVTNGVVDFVEFGHKQIVIREGEFLLMEGLTVFQIRKIELDNNILLSLHGKVGELKTGAGGFERSRMPSWLEWLRANLPFSF